jgi:hypothetical protein
MPRKSSVPGKITPNVLNRLKQAAKEDGRKLKTYQVALARYLEQNPPDAQKPTVQRVSRIRKAEGPITPVNAPVGPETVYQPDPVTRIQARLLEARMRVTVLEGILKEIQTG